jgi:hypothetical protein
MNIIPFDPPHLLTADRKEGFVDIPGFVQDDVIGRRWDSNSGAMNTTTVAAGDELSSNQATPTICAPPILERKQTMSGNIVTVTSTANSGPEKEVELPLPCAFWLQRTLLRNNHGVVRLGYQLRQQGNSNKWELSTDAYGRQKLFAVHIMQSSVLENNCSDNPLMKSSYNAYSPLSELSVLQLIANHSNSRSNNNNEPKHVVGTNIVAVSSQHVYAVLPYHRDGTLLQFCQMVGSLPEPLARYIFRQILKVGYNMSCVGMRMGRDGSAQ